MSEETVEFIEISDKGIKKKVGNFATMRLKFLKTFKEDMLNSLLKDDMLDNHLINIELQAEVRLNEIIEYRKQQELNLIDNINDMDKYIEQFKTMALKQVEEEILFV